MGQPWELETGQRLGNLLVQRELGRGAFGVVYLARDELLGRSVALKVVPTPSRAAGAPQRDAVLAEARLVARLESPHIVTLYRVDQLAEGAAWLFEMEYVDGGSLEDRLVEGEPLGPEEAERIFGGLAEALRVAHDHDVVHGDIKPGNLLIGVDGAAKLADFGLAQLRSDPTLAAGRSDRRVGTPLYMAPEVIMGAVPGFAADVWTAGIVLYRMISGKFPFPTTNLSDLFCAVQNDAPAALPTDTPRSLARMALRCLAKRPEDRPRSRDLRLDARLAPSHARRRGLEGRAEEVSLLRKRLDEVAAGRGWVVLVTGETGIGKSSLVRELRDLAQRSAFRWIDVTVSAAEGMLRPLVDALRDFERPLPDDQGDMAAVTRALCDLARESPLGLVLENIDEVDRGERKLLETLIRRVRGNRLFLALTTRDGATAAALSPPGAENVTIVRLDGLADEAMAALLERQCDDARLAADAAHEIIRRADGNPLFAKELLGHLLETGGLTRAGRELRLRDGWDATPLPDRLQELVAHHLGRLRPDERELLDTAAVDGPLFDGAALAAVTDRPLLAVLRLLQSIYRERGLVLPDRNGFRFARELIRQALYDELAPELRCAVHRRLAEHLEGRCDEGSAERLGLHWEQAGELQRAAPYLRRAALEAAHLQRQRQCVDLARRAGIVPGGIDAKTALGNAELIWALAVMLVAQGRHAEAESCYQAVLDAAREAGDEETRLRTAVRHARSRYFELGKSVDTADLRRATKVLPPCPELAGAHVVLGVLAKVAGKAEEAAASFETADEICRSIGLTAHRPTIVSQLASLAFRDDRFADARRLYDEAVELYAELGQRTYEALSALNRTVAAFENGELEGAEAELERRCTTVALEGAPDLAAQGRVLLGWVRYAQGDLAGAVRATEDALEVVRRSGFLPGLTAGLLHQAELLIAQGRLTEAATALEDARAAARKAGDVSSEGLACAYDAQRLCLAGDPGAAADAVANGIQTGRDSSEIGHRRRFGLLVAEAGLHGLPPGALEATQRFLAVPNRRTPELPRAAVAAALEFVRAGSHATAALHEAAATLRAPTVGHRRAVLDVVAGWLASEALRRDGHPEQARAEAEQALRRARSLGHVWLEAALLRHLVPLAPERDHAQEFVSLVERVKPGLGSAIDPTRFAHAWRVTR